MKKILAVIMVIAMLAIPVMAADESLGSVPSTSDTISIDGVKDAIYDQGLILAVNSALGSDAIGIQPVTATGTAYILRSADTLYVLVEVVGESDFRVLDESAFEIESWGDDGVEVILNRPCNDIKESSVEYRISPNGYMYFDWEGNQDFGAAADARFEAGCTTTDTSYTVEYAIPLDGATDKLDFFIFGQDAIADGSGFNGYFTLSPIAVVWTAAEYNYLSLDGAEVTANASTGSENVDTDADVTVDTDADVTDDAPQTFDVAVISAIAAVITLAGAVISKKRK